MVGDAKNTSISSGDTADKLATFFTDVFNDASWHSSICEAQTA